MVDAVRPHWNHGVLPHTVTQVCSLKLQEINDLSAALRQAEVKSLNATRPPALPRSSAHGHLSLQQRAGPSGHVNMSQDPEKNRKHAQLSSV